MLRTTLAASAAATLLTFAASTAGAADNGIYIGGSLGQASINVDDLDFDSDDNGFKGILGVRPLDFLGFELNYVDLGKPDETILGSEVTADATGIDGFVVGFLGLPFMDVFAKAGLISWDAKLTVDSVQALADDGQDFAWGVGAQVRFGSAAIRAEYERFEIEDLDNVSMISLGFTWTFL